MEHRQRRRPDTQLRQRVKDHAVQLLRRTSLVAGDLGDVPDTIVGIGNDELVVETIRQAQREPVLVLWRAPACPYAIPCRLVGAGAATGAWYPAPDVRGEGRQGNLKADPVAIAPVHGGLAETRRAGRTDALGTVICH